MTRATSSALVGKAVEPGGLTQALRGYEHVPIGQEADALGLGKFLLGQLPGTDALAFRIQAFLIFQSFEEGQPLGSVKPFLDVAPPRRCASSNFLAREASAYSTSPFLSGLGFMRTFGLRSSPGSRRGISFGHESVDAEALEPSACVNLLRTP